MTKFQKGMLLYALVFLLLAAVGLAIFWDYLEAYEGSQSTNTMEMYLSQLDGEEIYDHSEAFTRKLDHRLEPENQCRAVISRLLERPLTYARDAKHSSRDQLVYRILLGEESIGTVTLTQQEADRYGFALWQVADEAYDLSFLLKEGICVTVPPEYTVAVNSWVLEDTDITQSGVHYEALESFYADYELPTLVTYEAGPFLEEPRVEIRDGEGKLVERTEEAAFLDNCTEEEQAQLRDFTEKFLHRYVTYTGSASREARDDYLMLMYYVVYGSELGNLLYDAMFGLGYAQSRGDSVASITIHSCSNLGGGRYYLDVSYEVDTLGHAGLVRTMSNAKIIVIQTQYGLKAEDMLIY